jgi:hypothetical protein
MPGHPVAVAIVVGNYVPEAIAEQVKQFARRHAPEIAIGVMDFGSGSPVGSSRKEKRALGRGALLCMV